MDTSLAPALEVQFPSGLNKSISAGSWTDSKTYSVSTASDFIPPNESGSATLKIANAKDLAGNLLDGNPKTIAFRDASGSWSGKDSPLDTLHRGWRGLIPFLVELEKVRFAKIDRAINNRRNVENSYVS